MRLSLHISSTRYLEDRALYFTQVTEHDNTSFDHEVVEDKDDEEDGKEAVTDLEEEASKKRVRGKVKRYAVRGRALLLTALLGLSAPASAFIPLPGLSAAMPRLSAPIFVFVSMLGLSAAMPESSAVVPGSFVTVPELSVAMPELSALASASVPMPGLSALVFPSMPVLPRSSTLFFPTLSLPKTSTPNLAAERRRLDDTISRWSKRSKRIFSEELCSGRIKRGASKEAFSPKAPLFLPLFPSSSIGKRKLDKTFINTRPLADNYVKEEVDLSFVMYEYPPAIKLNKSWQIELLEQRPAYIVVTIPLAMAIF